MIDLGNGSYSIKPLPSYVKIGKYSSIADNVIFHSLTQEHQWTINKKCVYSNNWDQPLEDGEIIIGNDVWIGEGVRILPNIHIGDGAIIGAGSVVNRWIKPYAVVVGNPARIVRFRFDQDRVEKLLTLQWWNWSLDKIMEAKEDMKDIEVFLQKYYETKHNN